LALDVGKWSVSQPGRFTASKTPWYSLNSRPGEPPNRYELPTNKKNNLLVAGIDHLSVTHHVASPFGRKERTVSSSKPRTSTKLHRGYFRCQRWTGLVFPWPTIVPHHTNMACHLLAHSRDCFLANKVPYCHLLANIWNCFLLCTVLAYEHQGEKFCCHHTEWPIDAHVQHLFCGVHIYRLYRPYRVHYGCAGYRDIAIYISYLTGCIALNTIFWCIYCNFGMMPYLWELENSLLQ
jgi:hypothetical protein